MEERAKTAKNLTQPQEVTATIHYAHNGPSLESCRVSSFLHTCQKVRLFDAFSHICYNIDVDIVPQI